MSYFDAIAKRVSINGELSFNRNSTVSYLLRYVFNTLYNRCSKYFMYSDSANQPKNPQNARINSVFCSFADKLLPNCKC